MPFAVRPRVVPLLGYLLLHSSHPIARGELAFRIWPDDPEDVAISNLRRHLHHLREALPAGHPWVVADTLTVQWNPDADVTVDVRQFNALIERSDTWAEAVDLYAGDLLEGQPDEWLLAPRERLRSQYVEALRELATDARRRRDDAGAHYYLERLLGSDPWREDAVRELMLLRYQRGDRAGALALCRSFERRLRDEMNTTLMRETAALRDDVAAGVPAALPSPPSSLPVPASSFIGRAAELSAVRGLLERSRLVTVTGAPGIGKTRIALHVAAGLRDEFGDGVWFADVASLPEASRVPGAIARTLRLRPSADPLEALRSYLARRHLLLVLDNCERFVDCVAALVQAIVQAAPNVSVLATSRQSLGLGTFGEDVYRVPPLSLPAAGPRLTWETASRSDAIALFRARAQAAGNRSLESSDPAAVLRICHRLDGMPLAIELAAARAASLSVAELEVLLHDRFKWLVSSGNAGLTRHNALKSLIDWSYELLCAAEQRFFARLSIFSGTFTRAAAERICSDDAVEAAAVVELLSALVDKSLVVCDHSSLGTRYRLLESIKEYARERLRQTGEEDRLAGRHAAVYAEMVERHVPGIAEDRIWFEEEQGNWSAAIRWALAFRNDVVVGQRLAAWAPLHLYSTIESLDWIELALAAVDATTPRALFARLVLIDGKLRLMRGDFQKAALRLSEALALFRESGDRAGLAQALQLFSEALETTGRASEAAPFCLEAVAISRELKSKLLPYALVSLAKIRDAEGDVASSHALFREALRLIEPQESPFGERDVLGAARIKVAFAASLSDAGSDRDALACAREALAVLRSFREPYLGVCLSNIASYEIALERYDDGERSALEALAVSRDLELGLIAVYSVFHLATVAALRTRVTGSVCAVARAARLIGFVDAAWRSRNVFLWPRMRADFDRSVDAMRCVLGADDVAKLMAEGMQMSDREAFALAASELAGVS